ncbi:MAG: redoxin domain-containing protein [Prolixibacteraceae bacterium]|nr:redoxin domain-containing protein [Prolixibacteraceae bacterium]
MHFSGLNFLFHLLFLSIFFQGTHVFASNVKLSGKAPEYALNTIVIGKYHDIISEEIVSLGTIKFNSEGTFSLEFDLNETSFCFAGFDGYLGMIYLEPGKSYELLFPPKRNLTESQKRNPFVKPDPVWFGIAQPDKNELNFLIQQFEQAYAKYENKYFNQIFLNRNKSLVDTVKNILDKEFGKTESTIFESHKFYRKANLEYALNQGKSAEFIEKYFRNEKPSYQLAAYTTLFNQFFLNYFSLLSSQPTYPGIKKLIDSGFLQQLDDYFQKQLHFNKELSHWALLKAIKEAYYSNQFSKTALLKMLDQTSSLGWSAYEQKTAQLIRTKLTYLSSGTNPPILTLKNLSGQKINISDFKNSYVYLHFTDPKNTICQQHLETLKTTASRYKDKLTIINIIPQNSKFANEKNWAGIFATTESSLEETYKVKTFPTSFLIGKDGKLLLSPAPNPIDGLDRQLGQIFKSDYFKEIQKNNNSGAK